MTKKDEVIRLKLLKANTCLAEVNVLMENCFYSSAINRLYYACFNATNALLLTKKLMPKTHSGTVSLLNQHFVKEGLFPNDKATLLGILLRMRIVEDYGDYLISDKPEVEKLIEPAREFVLHIERLLYKK